MMKTTLLKVTTLWLFLCIHNVFAEHEIPTRMKRQSNAGDALVDAVFQVPIQTLTSVGSLLKATRPVIMNVRQRLQQNLSFQPQRFSFPPRQQQQQQQANKRISSAASSYSPNSSFNRLAHAQQPSRGSSHRFSAGKNKFFRDSD